MSNSNRHKLDIKEIQSVSLGILKRVADFCDSMGIRYVLAYGTLIGAIRHKGFIPWDDDVDIMMPRPDYDRFLSIFEVNKDRLNDLKLFNRTTNKKYPFGITRVCDMNYEIVTNNENNCGMGVFIDIYPMDGLGKTYDESMSKLEKSHALCDKIALLTRKKIYCPHQPNIKKQINYMGRKLIYMIKGGDYYFSLLNENVATCDYDNSNYVGVASWVFNPTKDMYGKSIVEDRIKVEFEGMEFYAPKEYDKCLRITYGDYMKLPPVEQRIYQHGYEAYEKLRTVI